MGLTTLQNRDSLRLERRGLEPVPALLLMAPIVAGLLLSGCTLHMLPSARVWASEPQEEVVSVQGTGEVVTIDAPVNGFDRVRVSHAFSVDIRQGEGHSVSVRVDEALAPYVEVVVEGDTLAIGLKPDRYQMDNVQTMEADVTLPALSGLELSGASRATMMGFDTAGPLSLRLSGASTLQGQLMTGDLELRASGSSRVTLTGSARDLTIGASGASQIDLAGLAARDADLSLSGSSVATVDAAGKLSANASGASRVHYLGDPTVGPVSTSGASSVGRKTE